MIFIDAPKVSDDKILLNLENYCPELWEIKDSLELSYSLYIFYGADPSKIDPIKLTEIQDEKLLAGYGYGYTKRKEDVYFSNWIYELRHSDSLPYCPMCGNTGRDAIDHYLPKDFYPEFAFYSKNLVPTCTACNGKRNKHANAPGVELSLLHPYMDGAQLNQALVFVKINGILSEDGALSYAIPSFSIVPCLSDDDKLYRRLKNHLEKCVSASQFVRWVTGRWGIWRKKAPGYLTLDALRVAVQVELDAEIEVGGMNNWTAAFLRGLLLDKFALDWIRNNP